MAIINALNDLADKVRQRTGLENEMTIEQMGDAVLTIPYPAVEEIGITQNGTYTPPTGVDGYNPVIVEVPIPEFTTEELIVEENGTYTPSTGVDGFSVVEVNVPGGPEPVGEIEITANGTYDVAEYASATVNVPQDGAPPAEAFNITGDCTYKFASNGWNWFIEQYGNQITTENISNLNNMFYDSNELEEIPFDININNFCGAFSYAFRGTKIKSAPLIIGPERAALSSAYSSGKIEMSDTFSACFYLREIPYDYFSYIVPNQEYWDSCKLYNFSRNSLFNLCYSLRQHPDLTLLECNWTYSFYCLYSSLFNSCFTLDEAINIPTCSNATGNYFDGTFSNCFRLANMTLATDNGVPKVVNWKSQTIDLSSVGYKSNTYGKQYLLDYNSGITADKEVKDDATYQALKNDPDWFTVDVNYSRYNHDSAVRTINSLPDTSAYLATAGGTNTIKFKGASGALTDGGAINTLTAEEIAVATAKGWTVTLV